MFHSAVIWRPDTPSPLLGENRINYDISRAFIADRTNTASAPVMAWPCLPSTPRWGSAGRSSLWTLCSVTGWQGWEISARKQFSRLLKMATWDFYRSVSRLFKAIIISTSQIIRFLSFWIVSIFSKESIKRNINLLKRTISLNVWSVCFTIYHFGILEGVVDEFRGLLVPSDLHSLENERKRKSRSKRILSFSRN